MTDQPVHSRGFGHVQDTGLQHQDSCAPLLSTLPALQTRGAADQIPVGPKLLFSIEPFLQFNRHLAVAMTEIAGNRRPPPLRGVTDPATQDILLAASRLPNMPVWPPCGGALLVPEQQRAGRVTMEVERGGFTWRDVGAEARNENWVLFGHLLSRRARAPQPTEQKQLPHQSQSGCSGDFNLEFVLLSWLPVDFLRHFAAAGQRNVDTV